jgi:hypothetical protein
VNIYTSETEYLKTEVQRLSALVRAQQITIDKLEAQRTWVDLSEQDKYDCLSAGNNNGWIGVMETTANKLKEKNT